MDDIISWSDLAKIDMRMGTILEVGDFHKAQKTAYRLTLDLGGICVDNNLGAAYQIIY